MSMKFKSVKFGPDEASMTPNHCSDIGHRMALTVVHHQAVVVYIPTIVGAADLSEMRRSLSSHLTFTEVASIGNLLLYSSHCKHGENFSPGPRQQEASQIKKEEVPVAVGRYWPLQPHTILCS